MNMGEAIDLIIEDPMKVFVITFPLYEKPIKDTNYLINVGGQLEVQRWGKFEEFLMYSDKYIQAVYSIFEGKMR